MPTPSSMLLGSFRRQNTPDAIFGSALTLWLDAANGVVGSPVDTWEDRSASNNDVTSLFAWSKPSESPAVTFDGTDDFLIVNDNASLDASTQLIVGLVMTPDVITGARCPITKSATTSGSWSTQCNGAALRWHAGTPGTNFGEVSSFIAASTKVRAIVRYDGALSGNSNRLKIYKDGVIQSPSYTGTIPASLSNTSDAVVVGAYGDTAQYWDGRIQCVVMIKDYVASDDQITLLDNYLATF